jgi:hypothetical protein
MLRRFLVQMSRAARGNSFEERLCRWRTLRSALNILLLLLSREINWHGTAARRSECIRFWRHAFERSRHASHMVHRNGCSFFPCLKPTPLGWIAQQRRVGGDLER